MLRTNCRGNAWRVGSEDSGQATENYHELSRQERLFYNFSGPSDPAPASDDEPGERSATYCPILIVEDDPDLREMMAQLLMLEGFQAHAGSNGREALEYLGGTPTPEVILLDMMMPVMDGWEFLRLQQRDPKIARVPVIILSALDQSRIGNVGAVASLKKPLDFDRLLDLVRGRCHRPH